jgi:5-methylthioribose kinase
VTDAPADGLGPGSGYRPLTVETVPAWLDARPALRALVPGDALHVREVGDGNLNLVFVVRDDPGRPGVVLKQSLPWVRVHGESWPLTVERARHEADAYEAYEAFAGDAIARWHGFDAEWYVNAIEDLADLKVWRTALNDGEIHAGAAVAMGRLVARIAFHTSDFGMEPEARKRKAAATINPELCRITEDLVLDEPFREHEHNRHPGGIDGLVRELRADRVVLREIAGLKHTFMTHGEALIHGDLHTGSVMVGGGRAAAIDPEFAFYGPVGFDLGAIWANAAIAAARADRLDRPDAFRAHVAAIVPDSWDAFTSELRRLWPARIDRAFSDDFLDDHLARVWVDGLGFAAAKATRRMIGYAHVADIDSLDEPARSSAAGAVVRTARRWLHERRDLPDAAAMWSVVIDEIGRG